MVSTVKLISFWIIVLLHGLLIGWLLVAPFIGHTQKYLIFVGVVLVALALQRIMVGVCMLTVIEHWLNPLLVPSIHTSYAQVLLFGVFGKPMVRFVFEYIGLVYLGVVLLRIAAIQYTNPTN